MKSISRAGYHRDGRIEHKPAACEDSYVEHAWIFRESESVKFLLRGIVRKFDTEPAVAFMVGDYAGVFYGGIIKLQQFEIIWSIRQKPSIFPLSEARLQEPAAMMVTKRRIILNILRMSVVI